MKSYLIFARSHSIVIVTLAAIALPIALRFRDRQIIGSQAAAAFAQIQATSAIADPDVQLSTLRQLTMHERAGIWQTEEAGFGRISLELGPCGPPYRPDRHFGCGTVVTVTYADSTVWRLGSTSEIRVVEKARTHSKKIESPGFEGAERAEVTPPANTLRALCTTVECGAKPDDEHTDSSCKSCES